MVLSAFRLPKPSTRPIGRQSFLSSAHASASTTRSQSPASEFASSILAATGPFRGGRDAAPDLTNLNQALEVLATVFPDVRHEVFREMLVMFSEESRVHVVAEQLLKHKMKRVNGRWRVPDRNRDATIDEVHKIEDIGKYPEEDVLPLEETFRTESYKSAARRALCLEFKTLSKSAVDGVLAERNHSYSLARPILLELAAKTWRNTFNAFLSRWKKPTNKIEEKHFMLIWTKSFDGVIMLPSLRESDDEELDLELRQTLLQPLLDHALQGQEAINAELAILLNEQEAESANALFECECCFSDTTFEQMATCTTGDHIICFSCIRHAVSEALYGQSWGLNLDHERGQVACLAPSDSACDGCLPHSLTKRAMMSKIPGGPQMWNKLESRLADEALLKSEMPLIRCPFCAYAEIDVLYLPNAQAWHIDTSRPIFTLLLLFLLPAFLSFVLLCFLLSVITPLAPPTHLFASSLSTLIRRHHLSPRFDCKAPSCLRPSCLTCHQAWRDPHICHESAARSLRTTIEAARTAALKRTCPRCALGFVKDSGCNKMVCPCGYAMCYLCRQGLGRRVGALPESDGEGYRHFCQHFRAAAGRCAQCDRCDLYRADDDGALVKRAGELAERDWRLREGVGNEVLGLGLGVGVGMGLGLGAPLRDRTWWSLQHAVDWVVEAWVRV